MTASRTKEERRVRTGMVRLLCAASMVRVALTRILPLCGAAAWWTALLCLLPGLLLTALLRLVMRLTRTATLPDAMRAALGRPGSVLLAVTLGGMLLVEGSAGMTALITLFTEGVGTEGTQLTLALLTAGMLLPCLHREGLARGIHLLRWPMLAVLIVLLGFALPQMRLDHLFPFQGDGLPSVRAALAAGAGMAWALALLLTVEPSGKSRAASFALPCAWSVGLLLAVALGIPHEVLAGARNLAECLLLPTRYAPSALRMLGQCLTMLALFLAVGASVQMGAAQLCAPWGNPPRWLPYVLAALLALTQAGNVSALWRLLCRAEPYLPVPLAALAVAGVLGALIRRKRT